MPINNPPSGGGGTFNGIIEHDGIGNTSTDGLVLVNGTAASSGVPSQWSPRIRWTGKSWNGDESASHDICFLAELRPAEDGSTETGSLVLSYFADNGSPSDVCSIGGSGQIDAQSLVASGVVVCSDLTSTGSVTALGLLVPHISGSGGSPTVTVGGGAGSGASSVTIDTNGTDLAFLLTVNCGTAPSANAVVATVTFVQTYNSAPHFAFSPANTAAAALVGAKQVVGGSTSATFSLTAGSTGLDASTQFKWSVLILQ